MMPPLNIIKDPSSIRYGDETRKLAIASIVNYEHLYVNICEEKKRLPKFLQIFIRIGIITGEVPLLDP